MKEPKDKIYFDNGLAYKIVDGKRVYILVKEPKAEDIYKKKEKQQTA
jgi:hypothetical protein